MTDPMLTLKGVTKGYPGFRLGPVDLEIEPGYVVAVVGPNGSGKSTLFRLLMGLAHADAGEVLGFGQPVGGDIALAARVGYVPERTSGHDWMSVTDLGRFYERWYPTFDTGRYEVLVAATGVTWEKPFGKLSKGMQRRVTFALAMASDPDLLLLDELTDGVDPFARREMVSDIGRFMERGDRSVLLATHNMDEVRRLADYVVFLVNGTFLGMYEKDGLLEGWRRAWLERAPDPETTGLVRVTASGRVEMISSWWQESERSLREQGVVIERTASMDLTEILEHLMHEAKSGGSDRRWPVAGETRSVRAP